MRADQEPVEKSRIAALTVGQRPDFADWCERVFGDSFHPCRSVPDAMRSLQVLEVDVVAVFLPDLDVTPVRAFEALSDAAPGAPIAALHDGNCSQRVVAELDLFAAGMSVAAALDDDPEQVKKVLSGLARRPEELRREVQSSRRTAEQLIRYEAWTAKSVERLDEWVHELRTPLGVIQGFTANLVDAVYGNLNQAQLDAISRIRKGSDLLCGLVEQVRTDLPSPPELDQRPNTRRAGGRTQLSLMALCEEVMEFFSTTAESAGIRLSLERRECQQVWGDRMRLTQALVNLVKNACRFTPAGGEVVISVAPYQTDENGSGPRCAISVADSGPGIAEKDRQQVFEAGFTTDAESGHQGMGLHIVQQVMKEHGGSLELETLPGRGTTFHLIIPVDPRQRRRKTVVRLVRERGLALDLLCGLRSRAIQVAEIHDSTELESHLESLGCAGEITLLATDERLGPELLDLARCNDGETSETKSSQKEETSAYGADR